MPDLPVTVTLPIQWGDMDSLGHVNNARYFTWFESARIELFRRVGMETSGAPSEGPILARTHCEFLEALAWPGEVVVGTGISRIGTKSFTMAYELARTDAPDRLAARGEGVIVMLDYRRGETVPISQALRDRLERLRVVPPEERPEPA
jgi:acyl-CoA thioester hydrolase